MSLSAVPATTTTATPEQAAQAQDVLTSLYAQHLSLAALCQDRRDALKSLDPRSYFTSDPLYLALSVAMDSVSGAIDAVRLSQALSGQEI